MALRPVLSNGLPFGEQLQNAVKLGYSQAYRSERLTLVSEPMKDAPRHLSELLDAGLVARVRREADRRRMETVRVRSLLPAEEAAHLVSASTGDAGELVLVMDTPAWAARVRYCTGSLPNPVVKIRVLPSGG